MCALLGRYIQTFAVYRYLTHPEVLSRINRTRKLIRKEARKLSDELCGMQNFYHNTVEFDDHYWPYFASQTLRRLEVEVASMKQGRGRLANEFFEACQPSLGETINHSVLAMSTMPMSQEGD